MDSYKHSLLAVLFVGLFTILATTLLVSDHALLQNNTVGAAVSTGESLMIASQTGSPFPPQQLACRTSTMITYNQRTERVFTATVDCFPLATAEERCDDKLLDQIVLAPNPACQAAPPSSFGLSCGPTWCHNDRRMLNCTFVASFFDRIGGSDDWGTMKITQKCPERRFTGQTAMMKCERTVKYTTHCEARFTCDGNCAVQ